MAIGGALLQGGALGGGKRQPMQSGALIEPMASGTFTVASPPGRGGPSIAVSAPSVPVGSAPGLGGASCVVASWSSLTSPSGAPSLSPSDTEPPHAQAGTDTHKIAMGPFM